MKAAGFHPSRRDRTGFKFGFGNPITIKKENPRQAGLRLAEIVRRIRAAIIIGLSEGALPRRGPTDVPAAAGEDALLSTLNNALRHRNAIE